MPVSQTLLVIEDDSDFDNAAHLATYAESHQLRDIRGSLIRGEFSMKSGNKRLKMPCSTRVSLRSTAFHHPVSTTNVSDREESVITLQ
ncbi:hypothetical protein [Corynebacterium ulcerans]|uniref:hypothetical protein n=1 Tax=Corynebacterium ulcerans TaxID=65058 RepID=UPI002154FE75|nr:hypothetical protein [Corynebacterium ulcerans]